jgi:hypothetical protein
LFKSSQILKNEKYLCIFKTSILAKIKTLNSKISFQDHNDYTTVVISPRIERWQLNSLLVWLIAWTACGVYFAYYLLVESVSLKESFVMLVLLVFWLYFEIRITRAFLWRKHGLEIITINKETLSIKDSIFLHGKPAVYPLQEIELSTIENIHLNPKSYGKVMNDSFWQIGQGTCTFKYNEKNIFFGTQLENDESQQLVKLIKKIVQQYKSE